MNEPESVLSFFFRLPGTILNRKIVLHMQNNNFISKTTTETEKPLAKCNVMS